jgi:hypothetical protein
VRLDLHLDGPAEVSVSHSELIQGAPSDGTKGTQDGVTDSPEDPHEEAGELVSPIGLRGQGAGFSLSEYSAADDHVGLVLRDRFYQGGEFFG